MSDETAPAEAPMGMDADLRADIEASGRMRADFYRFLASIFLYELTQEQIEALAATGFPRDGSKTGEGYALIAEYLRHRDTGTRQELAVDYAHVFLGAGNYDKLIAPPYESVYTSEEHLLMQDARDGALKYYRGEDLDLPAENTTPEDHVGFEMQFMATLVERANQALADLDAARFADLVGKQCGFFAEHLANWLPAFSTDIAKNARTDFYRGVALLVDGLLEEEREVLDGLAEAVAAPAGA